MKLSRPEPGANPEAAPDGHTADPKAEAHVETPEPRFQEAGSLQEDPQVSADKKTEE